MRTDRSDGEGLGLIDAASNCGLADGCANATAIAMRMPTASAERPPLGPQNFRTFSRIPISISLIGRGTFDVIDDEDLDRSLLRLQPQTQLLPKGREQ